MMNDSEKSVLSDLVVAITKIPENKREFLLGYATALIDEMRKDK